jgi:hypothetical protein
VRICGEIFVAQVRLEDGESYSIQQKDIATALFVL